MRWNAPTGARLLGAGLALTMIVGLGLAAAPLYAPGSVLAAAGHFSLSTLCHQIPERSFQLGGHAMSICHRCSGIYAGLGAGGLLAALGLRVNPAQRAVWIALAAVMLAQVVAGWLTDALDLWPLRVATGLVLGGWGGLALVNALGGIGRAAPASDQSAASTARRSSATVSDVAP